MIHFVLHSFSCQGYGRLAATVLLWCRGFVHTLIKQTSNLGNF
jgi:hypothetical protein